MSIRNEEISLCNFFLIYPLKNHFILKKKKLKIPVGINGVFPQTFVSGKNDVQWKYHFLKQNFVKISFPLF